MLPIGLVHAQLEDAVRPLVDGCEEIYLVGGVVRDFILKNRCSDIDFVVKQNAIAAARNVADHFNGDYYILDDERGTARALIQVNNENIIVDFATMVGNDIEEDLAQRDFTINAIAQRIDVPWKPIDPLGGLNDLERSLLRPCSSASFRIDPVRTIRAVRFIQKLDLRIDNETIKQIKEAAPLLKKVSFERKRDELFHVFETKDVKSSLILMREFGLWSEIFPNLEDLEALDNMPPHVHNALEHTLAVLDYCQKILYAVTQDENQDAEPLPRSTDGLITTYKRDLRSFLEKPIHPQRKYDGLLFLAVLYHDIGKLFIPAKLSGARVNFPGHAEASSSYIKENRERWSLSNAEYQFIRNLIGSHMLSKEIKGTEDENSRRALYRFYKQAGSAGVLVSLFYLADILSTYEETLTSERWQQALVTSRALLESWFRKHGLIVDPPEILNGSDLIKELGLQQGRQLGKILEAVREAQSAGIINNRKMALEFAGNLIDKKGS